MADNANELRLVVLTPAKKVVDATCANVYFPSSLGTLGILPGHAALVCQIGTGVLHFDRNNQTSFLTVSGGVAEVRDNTVTLLVDVAEDAALIDVARAQKALEKAQSLLTGKETGTGVNLDEAIAAQARARARIEAAARHGERR